MKYHINNKGEVKPCRAKVKCRFGGANGNENHFTSASEAEKYVQEKLTRTYDPMRSVRRVGSPNAQFIKNRDNLRDSLVSFGVKNAENLPDVNSVDEIVNKWFNGDSDQYKRTKNLIETSPGITNETKKSLGGILQSHVNLNVVTVDNLSRIPDTDAFSSSDVDLLEDSDENTIDVKALMNGEITAFSN